MAEIAATRYMYIEKACPGTFGGRNEQGGLIGSMNDAQYLDEVQDSCKFGLHHMAALSRMT